MTDSIENVPDIGKEMPDSIENVPDTGEKMLDSTENVPDTKKEKQDTLEEVSDIDNQLSKQQKKIYEVLVNNGTIRTAEVEQLLDVKQRRARAILQIMEDNGIIQKVGAARSTRYILTERWKRY
ncbi:MAG: hypothetical protein LUF92_15705 [Clostridiales bacterium]|nr:hypothetical protein [Clostridiales bacterium]